MSGGKSVVQINQYLARLQWSSGRDHRWGLELTCRLGVIVGKTPKGLSQGSFHSSLLQGHPTAPCQSWHWPKAAKPPGSGGAGCCGQGPDTWRSKCGSSLLPFCRTNWWKCSSTQRRILVKLWRKYTVFHWKGKCEWIWKMAWMCLLISSESSLINTREETVLRLLLSMLSLIRAHCFEYIPTSKVHLNYKLLKNGIHILDL